MRYNSVRRQFKTYNGRKEERKILDYQTQQHILTPVLAQTYHMNIIGHYMKEQFTQMMNEIEKNDYSRMDINHHLVAGFKASFSEEVIIGSEICRRSCGGAGYHSFSGFTELY
jgi:acyl-CoA oxidase